MNAVHRSGGGMGTRGAVANKSESTDGRRGGLRRHGREMATGARPATVAALRATITALLIADAGALLRLGHVALTDVNLLSGPVPWSVHVLAASSFALIVVRADRRWLRLILPSLLGAT